MLREQMLKFWLSLKCAANLRHLEARADKKPHKTLYVEAIIQYPLLRGGNQDNEILIAKETWRHTFTSM